MDGLRAAGLPNVWCTGPGAIFSSTFWGGAGGAPVGSYSLVNACVAEFIGTMVLLWGVLASGDEKNMGLRTNLGVFLVGGTVLAIGLSLGGPSGYAINPARDFGPRLFGLLVGTKDLFDGIYWLFPPIIMTILGGTVGSFVYDWIVTSYLERPE
jgi:glycerol uptake facilitator protein